MPIDIEKLFDDEEPKQEPTVQVQQPITVNPEQPTNPEPVKVAVTGLGGFVQIRFDRPIIKLAITKKHARELAASLIKEAL